MIQNNTEEPPKPDSLDVRTNWSAINRRRGWLIDQSVFASITPEQAAELEHLQSLADEKIRIECPDAFKLPDSLLRICDRLGIDYN